MKGKSRPETAKSVEVVEAHVFDRMDETRALIAQRAYEIYQSRGRGHGFDQDDWFSAEGELLPKFDVKYDVTDSGVRLALQVPGFDAKDLEVAVGHRQAAVCGVHIDSNHGAPSGRKDKKDKKVMRIFDLPFDVDPALAGAKLQSGTLQVILPRSR